MSNTNPTPDSAIYQNKIFINVIGQAGSGKNNLAVMIGMFLEKNGFNRDDILFTNIDYGCNETPLMEAFGDVPEVQDRLHVAAEHIKKRRTKISIRTVQAERLTLPS